MCVSVGVADRAVGFEIGWQARLGQHKLELEHGAGQGFQRAGGALHDLLGLHLRGAEVVFQFLCSAYEGFSIESFSRE